MPETNAARPYSLLILAGGQGRRMQGKDKGLLDWQGQPLIAHIVDALAENAHEVLVSCNRNSDRYPINGIYKNATHYEDITSQFSSEELSAIWLKLKNIGDFRISRFGLKAASIEHLLAGTFQVIEINLFLPMPLTLLSNNTGYAEKLAFCLKCMWQLAKITKSIPSEQPHKSVFFK